MNGSELVAALRATEDRTQQEALWSQLAESIQSLARRHAPRADPNREHLIVESPGLIFERLSRYDPERPFGPWCKRVLLNYWSDRQRNTKVKRTVYLGDIDLQARRSARSDTGVLNFTDRDLDQIRHWEPRLRIVLLVLGELFVHFPEQSWQRYLDEAGVELTIELPIKRSQCSEALMKGLRWSRSHLDQAWLRNRGKLQQLDAVRALHKD